MSPPAPSPFALLDKYRGQDFQPLYAATVTVSGGDAQHARVSGVARSDDGRLELDLSLPEALGGTGAGANPEQLFAAGYAASFHSALSQVAATARAEIGHATVRVTIVFGRDPVDGLFMLTAQVLVSLPGMARPLAEELVRNTERVCPYAKLARQGITNIVALAN